MTDQNPDEVAAVPIIRDEIQVMFLRSPDDPAVFGPLWERLEALVGLRGRKFFGAFNASTQEYHACVQMKEGDDPSALGLESGTLPGGLYLRARLHGKPPGVYERIGPTFKALMSAARSDETRPDIEFYRSFDEIDLLLPITGPVGNVE
jgi:hypothetical protein